MEKITATIKFGKLLSNCIYICRIRGRLGSLLMLNVTIGILLGFIAGTHLPYDMVPKIFLPLPLIFFVLFCFYPETPQFFISRKKFDVRIPIAKKKKHQQIIRNMEITVEINANRCMLATTTIFIHSAFTHSIIPSTPTIATFAHPNKIHH